MSVQPGFLSGHMEECSCSLLPVTGSRNSCCHAGLLNRGIRFRAQDVNLVPFYFCSSEGLHYSVEALLKFFITVLTKELVKAGYRTKLHCIS